MSPRKILSSYDLPKHWRHSTRYMPKGFRCRDAKRKRTNHFSGGEAVHQGSVCSKCKRSLTLFWDVDLSDPQFPAFVSEAFGSIGRLPFYMCWQCLYVSYRVVAPKEVTLFRLDSYCDPLKKEESPYSDSLNVLPRRKVSFEPIPSDVEGILLLEDEVGFDALDAKARGTLDEYYGEPTRRYNLGISQFGGGIFPYQGRRDLPCPNRKCPASKLVSPYEGVREFLMRPLAIIDHDFEPELAKEYFQFVYYICCLCCGIRGQYECT
jgi:hypothetical protein